MYHGIPTLVFAFALLVVAPMRGQAPTARMPPGLVLVAEVKGAVTMTVAGTTTELSLDDRVPQTATINTGPNSAAMLVFSNGATVRLGAETELVLQEFLQDPFAETIKLLEMVEEPSRSRSALALNRGELVGNVKKLKLDKGSSLTVATPAGVADTGCGTFRIVFRPTGTGQFVFTLDAVGCDVGFTSPPEDGRAKTGGEKRMVVRAGQEIGVKGAIDAQGQFRATSAATITAIPPAALNRSVTAESEGLFSVVPIPQGEQQSPGRSNVRTPQTRARPQIATRQPMSQEPPSKKIAGTANMGNIAVDARWSNYGAYLQRMIDTVQIQWERTLLKQKEKLVMGSSVTVKFVINDEGRIVKIDVVDTTAGDTATRACVNAITDRMPYGPWTDDMKSVLGTQQEMKFRFCYQ